MTNKLCKDCKHFTPSIFWSSPENKSRWATCGRTSRVDGNDGKECKQERQPRVVWFAKNCGPEGRYWEAA